MKKALILAVALTLVIAGIALADVVGSKHDLSGQSGSTQVCVYCHHPHRGEVGTLSNALLWNLNDQAQTSYTTYGQSGSMNATTVDVDSTAPQSYLCMNCHDGTISSTAMVTASVDSGVGISSTINLPGAAALGTSLAGDHPVNFLYSDSAVDPGIVADPEAIGYKLFDIGGQLRMECATCHDVHAGSDTQDTTNGIQFMRGDTGNSQICRDCHTNK